MKTVDRNVRLLLEAQRCDALHVRKLAVLLARVVQSGDPVLSSSCVAVVRGCHVTHSRAHLAPRDQVSNVLSTIRSDVQQLAPCDVRVRSFDAHVSVKRIALHATQWMRRTRSLVVPASHLVSELSQVRQWNDHVAHEPVRRLLPHRRTCVAIRNQIDPRICRVVRCSFTLHHDRVLL